MKYEYFKLDTILPPCLLIPDLLFTEEFEGLTNDSRVLYGYLLHEITNPEKEQRVDEKGNLYLIYPLKRVQKVIQVSKTETKEALQSLERVGLLYCKNDRIYVMNYEKKLA